MLVRLSIIGAVGAVLMLPTMLSAQGIGGAVNPGAAVLGAVVRGIPTATDLGASTPGSSSSLHMQKSHARKRGREVQECSGDYGVLACPFLR
jgi:hypothetical protein